MNSFVFSSLIVWSASAGHQRFNFVNNFKVLCRSEHSSSYRRENDSDSMGGGIVVTWPRHSPQCRLCLSQMERLENVSEHSSGFQRVFTTATLLSHELGLASVVQLCNLSYKVQCRSEHSSSYQREDAPDSLL